ncbi:PIN domain-containing protein [Streptomyces albipurpureus]|uniref:PIN domain-containing protein n=1 Tax=Streptomyces albipurpureus TaxID=2897419 RepID=A0ABT0UKX7_9ACTN|nr:PIN domain-containing protein [Streptomyces sp. CWNU-1]MCM2388760.1 PIN domain-containing protein [Streptomyces sp. CWNU-1]
MIVTPIPGARLDVVFNLLRSAHAKAENLGNYSSAEEFLLNYLTWTTEQARLLGSHVRAKDVEALFFTPVYWALLNGAGHMEGRLVPKVSIGLVNQEVRQRMEDLGRAASSVQDTIRRWTEDVSTLVLDTSFFIEHEARLEDADLFKLANFPGKVRVAVPMAVVDELDRLKESRVSTHARWRARYGLAVLGRLLNGPAKLGFTEVEVLSDPPGHVRLPDEDDEIVDRALALRTVAAGPVTLVTYDTGMALRAKIADVPCRKLSKDLGPEPEKK